MPNKNIMSFIFSGTFIGLLIILFGISIVLKEVFHISFPVFRILFGLLIIYFGVRMIAGGFYKTGNTQTFGNSRTEYHPNQREYNIIFGNGIVDLSTMANVAGNRNIEVNVVFGNGILKINENVPTMIELSTAFGQAGTPERSANGFGETIYTTPGFDQSQPHLFIKASAVFGKLTVETGKW
ncbi:MAG: YitT family protein [Bacteroidia bacterium]